MPGSAKQFETDEDIGTAPKDVPQGILGGNDQSPVEEDQPTEEPTVTSKVQEAQDRAVLAAAADTFPLAEQEPYYSGMWGTHPNYSCPYCLFATLRGSGAVELHILERIDVGDKNHLPALTVDKEA